ncbi:transcriptional regulator, NifA subfamily, Fis Family [Chthoniobacter flavus Ellin428]|uniref:Transcriptional regulator, NifA subfamily, Fis Family n=1 Tax=Chthoniobacter flavus Ellin428 TaxID=497964 RepID=B4DAQ1_9BACT|nr:sigma 54-interacting transcriptional regulator [Chthoniobacter flavus]EDY16461.1 transcriptional regulator, NifA subfamily, Fis Family [Chthoniobacter flavus Ellin428]TCO92732.1 PAS domain S-box-containing protein [Chthoniobacter flavus]
MSTRTNRVEVASSPAPVAESELAARLVENSPDCIKVLDLEGRLLSMNAGGMKLLEICDLQSFIGASWIDFWQGADREAAEAAVSKAREGSVGKFVGYFPTRQSRTPKWFDVVVSPIADESGKPERLLASSRDVTTYKRADRALRALAEGTASATGDEFFRSLARYAAQALGARYAFAAETLSELESQSLAYWEGSDFGAGFTYRFPGTPCQRVAAGHVCMTTSGLAAKFPEDVWLQQIGAESYVGVPMRNASGRTIGHIAVLHTQPMEPTEEDIATLKIFAARGCAELERKQADDRLRQAHAELRRTHIETEALLNITRAIGHHLQRDVLFGALAECLQTAVPTDCFGIALPVAGARIQAHILNQKNIRSEGAPPTLHEAKGSAAEWVMKNREWYVAATRREVSERFPKTSEMMQREQMESACVLPLVAGDRVRGALFFLAAGKESYAALQHAFMNQVASAVAVALDDCLVQEEMRRLGEELAAQKIARLEQQKEEVTHELEETSKALDASEERFRDLFDEAPIAYVHEELDSHFIRANRAAIRILGIKPEDVPHTYGKTFAPDTPDAQRRMREAFESIGRGTDTSGVVLEMRRKDNGKPFWIQWWSRPDPSGKYTRTMFLDITDRVLMEQDKARLEAQNTYLQEEIRSQHNFVEIVGNSPSLLQVLRQVDRVASTDSTVLICGETGTGKELIARAIHDRSPRRERPLVKVNCGAISTGLVESELFGHVKGAFTGAIANREGRFELADGGTIFLDEVGELPPETQVKLLRVLQEQEFEPIGSTKTVKVDVRVIAATNRDLETMVREGKFRSDLFYRLNVVPLTMPPLRQRANDIPLLTMFFLEKFARKLGKSLGQIAEETMARLCQYPWPGNIRELQNVIERAVVLSTGSLLTVEKGALPGATGVMAQGPGWTPERAMIDAAEPLSTPLGATSGNALEDVERQHIASVLQQTNWRIEGANGAAKILNLQPSTLRSRMQKLGIVRPAR